MTRALSEACGSTGSRIIAAEAVQGAALHHLADLTGPGVPVARALSSRDFGDETARAAYAMGRRRGLAQGHQAGLAQGREEGGQDIAALQARYAAESATQLKPLMEAFQAGLDAMEAQLADAVLALAIDLSRQVLARELALDPQALLPMAREALRAMGDEAQQVELHVHPVDAAMLSEHLDQVRDGRCRLRADPALPRGSCRVEAESGSVDGSVTARWHAAVAALGRGQEPAP